MVPAIGFGLVEAAVLAIAAMGFTIQFAMTNVLNLAYGVIMSVAMFGGFYAVHTLGVNPWVSLVVGAAFGAITSYLLYGLVIAPFVRRGATLLTMVVITVSAATVITYTLEIVVGPQLYSYVVPAGSLRQFAGFVLTSEQLTVIGIAVALTLTTTGLLKLTTFGKVMRATAANRTIAAASGVPVQRITGLAWLLSGALCGLGGVTLAISVGNFNFQTGAVFITEVVAAAILGGVGNPVGSVVGALFVGVGSELAATYISPAYKDVFAFGLLVLVLLVRPSGLLATGQQHEALAQ